jgi:hypothetical protein
MTHSYIGHIQRSMKLAGLGTVNWPASADSARQVDVSRSNYWLEAFLTGSELRSGYRSPHNHGNPLSPKDSPTGVPRMQSTHRQSVSCGRPGDIDPLPRPISRKYGHRDRRSDITPCAVSKGLRRSPPQLFAIGQSSNSDRVMKEINNRLPATASMQACRNE